MVGAVIAAVTAIYGAVEQHKAAKDAKEAKQEQETYINDQKQTQADTEAEATAEAEKRRKELAARQGMMSTIKTSTSGDLSQAQIGKKTLLGQ